MSSYFSFEIKKVTKHNLTIIALSILLIASFALLYLNSRTINRATTLQGDAIEQVELQKNLLAENQQALKRVSPRSVKYQMTKKTIEELKTKLQASQSFLANIQHNHWRRVYDVQLKEARKSKLTDLTDQEKDWVKQSTIRFKYLRAHPMPYESDNAVTGVQLLLQLNRTYWPILFNLAIIFILTYLFTGSYKNNLDITTVLPLTKIKILLTNSAVGWMIMAMSFAFLTLLVFAGSSVIYGTGNLHYPYLIHKFVNNQTVISAVSTTKLLPQLFILQMVAFLFVVLFVQLAARIFHHQLSTLLFAVLVLLGGSLAIYVIEPLSRVAHWLPNTYLNPLKVVSGEFAYKLTNTNISFTSGLVTMLVGSLIILMIILMLDELKRIRYRKGEQK